MPDFGLSTLGLRVYKNAAPDPSNDAGVTTDESPAAQESTKEDTREAAPSTATPSTGIAFDVLLRIELALRYLSEVKSKRDRLDRLWKP